MASVQCLPLTLRAPFRTPIERPLEPVRRVAVEHTPWRMSLAAGTLMTTALAIVPLALGMVASGDWRGVDLTSRASYLEAIQLASGIGALVCGVADQRRKEGDGPSVLFAAIGLLAAMSAPPIWVLVPLMACVIGGDPHP
jgi:hypothetical protein